MNRKTKRGLKARDIDAMTVATPLNSACEIEPFERAYRGMKRTRIHIAIAVAAVFLAGCQTIPPGAERGPSGTMAYVVLVEASEPGARIEANGQDVGNAPVRVKIF